MQYNIEACVLFLLLHSFYSFESKDNVKLNDYANGICCLILDGYMSRKHVWATFFVLFCFQDSHPIYNTKISF